MARKRRGRAIDGILLLDKPQGVTSNRVLQQVKHLFKAQKAGHTGILDPMASGVLPICFGEATKISQFLLDSDKAYSATVRFGEKTDTADADGTIVQRCDTDHLSEEQIQQVLPRLIGDIKQIPPMYSALKRDGQPLYKLARQGIEVERKARDITIFSLRLDSFRNADNLVEADFTVSCSKGTYVRTLAEDIAKALGSLGHLTRLQRIKSSEFLLSECVSLETLLQIEQGGEQSDLDNLLLSAEVAVNHLPLVEVTEETGYHLRRGQSVFVPNVKTLGQVRLKVCGGDFIGIAEALDDGRIQPRRLIAEKHA